MGTHYANDLIQYGALGLCFFQMIAFGFFMYWTLGKLEHLHRKNQELTMRCIHAMGAIGNALQTRPCLRNDRIYTNGTLEVPDEKSKE